MPFDMNPVDPDIDQLARMELLGEIAARHHGGQGDFLTCLWGAVRSRRETHGLVKKYDNGPGNSPRDCTAAAAIFGLSGEIWNADNLATKQAKIAEAIRKLKRRIYDKARRATQKELA